MSHQEKKRKHINSLQSLNDAIHWSSFNSKCPIRRKKNGNTSILSILERCHPLEFFNCPIRRKKKHINSLNLNVPSTGVFNSKCPIRKKTETHQFSQSLNDAIHWSSSTLNVPSGEKTETHQFSPILERCIHWSPSTLNVPSGEKKKHINSLQSLNDVIHWSPSTLNVPSGEKNGNTSILNP
ncbi:hypothetical protein TNCV_3940191 [Trichonephila clavipes]|uniref:Uncharacterized protein n=1 Tax=Trichonephila clavipes TaxID=2585209 RepID=A0A8X6VVP5_TRICX|nr:hypothetical protein TNCV_3940191 [Trichonephila clavipes]